MPGSFCTSVLQTSDPDRAARFYTSLLGWTTKPATRDHTFFQSDGKTVASVRRMAHGHDTWIPQCAVAALERTIETATALGATLVDVTDVPDAARLATLRDREAALFGLWVSSIQPPSTVASAASMILVGPYSRCAGRFQPPPRSLRFDIHPTHTVERAQTDR